MTERSPPVVYWLAGAIAAAYGGAALGGEAFDRWLTAGFAVIPARFDPALGVGFSNPVEMLTALFGHAFLHGGILHLAMNLLVLLQVAGPPAQRLAGQDSGALRFLALFFGSAAAGALAYVWINPGSWTPAVGASGAICGVFAAMLLSAGRTWRSALREPALLNAAFWFLAINVGAAAAARATGLLPIAWEAHLGGFVGGLLLYPLLAPRFEPRASV